MEEISNIKEEVKTEEVIKELKGNKYSRYPYIN